MVQLFVHKGKTVANQKQIRHQGKKTPHTYAEEYIQHQKTSSGGGVIMAKGQ